MKLVGIYPTSILLTEPELLKDKEFSPDQKTLLQMALLNVDVSIENPDAQADKWIFRGRPFEVNIVKACRLHGISLDPIFYMSSSLVLPFNSTNKFSVAGEDETHIVLGAPGVLLKPSAGFQTEDFQ